VSWWAAPAIGAAVYYLLALIGAWRWHRWVGKSPIQSSADVLQPISILKPIRGRDPKFYEAIRSHAAQEYPAFEILFGLSDPDDPASEDIAQLQQEFPHVPISAYVVSTKAANVKVGVLAALAKHARHPLFLVNDSDIVVGPGYLRAIAAPLADKQVGLVTCLYRADGESPASRAEALGIATEFAPSVLVARLLGVAEFALGSTMVFRATSLQAIGGFAAIQDYLADDYQLGARIHALGLRIEFAPVIVQTDLGADSWAQTWRHQLRWSRTIRVSRRFGYYGYVITHATLWSAVAFGARQWWVGALTLGVRVAAGLVVARGILLYRRALVDCWSIPLRDLFGFVVWLSGLFGSEVLWRGKRLRLHPDGRLDP
jgi:ceramide glucosyltransferase